MSACVRQLRHGRRFRRAGNVERDCGGKNLHREVRKDLPRQQTSQLPNSWRNRTDPVLGSARGRSPGDFFKCSLKKVVKLQ